MPGLLECTLATDGDSLKLTIKIDDDSTVMAPINAHLSIHDEVSTGFFASGPCQHSNEIWECRFPAESASNKRLIELTYLADGSNVQIDIPSRLLFLEPSSDGDWIAGEEAQAELDRLVQAREAYYDQVIETTETKDASSIFSVIILASNVLLSAPMRVPGITIIPLTNSTLGGDGVDVLNGVMAQMGYGNAISPSHWMSMMYQRRPAAIVSMPKIRAHDSESAHHVAQKISHHLLDLVALKRGAAPSLIGGVVGSAGDQRPIHCMGFWIEGSGYTGNLLTGFLSGTEPQALQVHWRQMSSDPRLRLWLSLYADAISDERWDYRLFRCFNLLEGIAAQKVSRGLAIIDGSGDRRLLANGRPYTTAHARGKVFEMIRLVARLANETEGNFVSLPQGGSSDDLWDEVGIWVGIRNAVAHRGGWDLPEGETPDNQHSTIESAILRRSHDNSLASGEWAIVRSIRNAIESTLYAGLRGDL